MSFSRAEFARNAQVILSRTNDTISLDTTTFSRYGVAFISLYNPTSSKNVSINFCTFLQGDATLGWYQFQNEPYWSVMQAPSIRMNHTANLTTQSFIKTVNFRFQQMFRLMSFEIILNRTMVQELLEIDNNATIFFGLSEFGKFDPQSSTWPTFGEIQEINITVVNNNAKLPYNLYARSEHFHMAPWILMTLMYAAHLPLCIVLAASQPLRSRGTLPFLATLGQLLLVGVAGGAYYLPMNSIQLYSFIFDILRFPSIICLVSIFLFGYIRFIIINYINLRKTNFILQKKDAHKIGDVGCQGLKPELFILKWLGHWLVSFVITMIMFVFLCACNILLSLFTTFKFNIIAYVDFGFAAVGCICCVFLDFLIALRVNRGKRCMSFFRDDIYFYRYETLVGIFLALPLLVVYLVFALALDQAKYYIYIAVLNTVLLYFIWFFEAGFIIYVTLIKKLFGLCRYRRHLLEESKSILQTTITDPEGRDLFYKYTCAEFSVENLSAYEDINAFRQLIDGTEAQIEAAKIFYETYLNGSGSELELNVEKSICSEVDHKIRDGKVDKTLLDNIFQAVISNLTDTFTRFHTSQVFHEYNRRRSFVKESFGK